MNREKQVPSAQKICFAEDVAILLKSLRQEGKKIGLCHGVFDLVHLGHVKHLQVAKSYCDFLLVTITSDEFVNKGPGRPVYTEKLRAEMLASLECVDCVSINHAPSAEGLLSQFSPDFYFKGSDYVDEKSDVTGKIKSERDTIEQYGGELIFTDEITFSSSSLINEHLDIYNPKLDQFLKKLDALVNLMSFCRQLTKLKTQGACDW